MYDKQLYNHSFKAISLAHHDLNEIGAIVPKIHLFDKTNSQLKNILKAWMRDTKPKLEAAKVSPLALRPHLVYMFRFDMFNPGNVDRLQEMFKLRSELYRTLYLDLEIQSHKLARKNMKHVARVFEEVKQYLGYKPGEDLYDVYHETQDRLSPVEIHSCFDLESYVEWRAKLFIDEREYETLAYCLHKRLT